MSAGSSEPELLISRADGVLTLTLNRPHRFNAFTVSLHEALIDALRQAAADPGIRSLLLTGAGRGFCAASAPGRICRIAPLRRAARGPISACRWTSATIL